jgi:hypothetical protein
MVLLANQLKPWIKKQWCLPTAPDAEFVYHMEGILHVYTRPSGPARPQVCMDEVNAPWLLSMKCFRWLKRVGSLNAFPVHSTRHPWKPGST